MRGAVRPVTTIVAVTVLLVSASAVFPPVTAEGYTTSPAAVQQQAQFGFTQHGQCYEVGAVGNGSRSVASFYDYRPNMSYSSAGTRDLQENGASNLFVYHGTDGYSLVFVHDEYDEPGGGAVSMTFTGLPGSGRWVVEDDDYPGRDDRFDHDGSQSTIDWVWQDDRTDGAAFRGIEAAGDDGITVEPSFNEDAALWETWARPDSGGRVDTWRLLSGGGWPVTELDMDAPVTVRPDGCDRAQPTARLAAPVEHVLTGQSVTLSAANTTDDTGVVEYRWDLDGDGTVDRNTTAATVTTEFDRPGTYTPRVLVRDRAGNSATATARVVVVGPEDVATVSDGTATPLRTTLARVSGTQCRQEIRVPIDRCWNA